MKNKTNKIYTKITLNKTIYDKVWILTLSKKDPVLSYTC